ncbi:MAG: hypothetical protein U1F55_00700 [Chitinivorax sp.]
MQGGTNRLEAEIRKKSHPLVGMRVARLQPFSSPGFFADFALAELTSGIKDVRNFIRAVKSHFCSVLFLIFLSNNSGVLHENHAIFTCAKLFSLASCILMLGASLPANAAAGAPIIF